MYEVDLRQIEQEAKNFATDYTLGVTQSETWYAAYHAYKAATIKHKQSQKGEVEQEIKVGDTVWDNGVPKTVETIHQSQPVEQGEEEMLMQPTAKAGETPREKLFDRIRKLTAQLSTANAEIERLKGDYSDAYHTLQAAEMEVRDLRKEIERLKADARKIAGEEVRELATKIVKHLRPVYFKEPMVDSVAKYIEEYLNTLPV